MGPDKAEHKVMATRMASDNQNGVKGLCCSSASLSGMAVYVMDHGEARSEQERRRRHTHQNFTIDALYEWEICLSRVSDKYSIFFSATCRRWVWQPRPFPVILDDRRI